MGNIKVGPERQKDFEKIQPHLKLGLVTRLLDWRDTPPKNPKAKN